VTKSKQISERSANTAAKTGLKSYQLPITPLPVRLNFSRHTSATSDVTNALWSKGCNTRSNKLRVSPTISDAPTCANINTVSS